VAKLEISQTTPEYIELAVVQLGPHLKTFKQLNFRLVQVKPSKIHKNQNYKPKLFKNLFSADSDWPIITNQK
jgi:hypothetical protein